MDDFYRLLFDRSPDAQIVVDSSGFIRHANSRAEEIFGSAVGELVGSAIELLLGDLTHPDDRSISESAVNEMVSGAVRSFEGRRRYRHADGHDVWVDVHASLIESSGTDRTAAHAESERRLRLSLDAERNLLVESQEQQQRLNVSMRAAGMGTFDWDVDSAELAADERAAAIVGLSAESMPVDRFLELIGPPDRERIMKAVRAALDEREPSDIVFQVSGGSGPRWVHGWGQPVEDEGGVVRKIVGVLQDVTAEREARRLIEERDQRLQLVLDVTVTGVFDWDLRRSTITFSDNWYSSVGFDPVELDTEHWDWQRIVHPDDWPDTARLIEAQVNGSIPSFTHDVRLRRQDGTWRWARLAARGVEHDERGRAQRIIGADTDISEQRLLEQQLVHSATMQSLGEFAGGIAHDFNNVMAIVRGHTEFLLRRDADDADTERRLTSIERAVERASLLVRELMLLGRPATDNPVAVDLVDHIGTTSASWRALLGDDIVLEVDLADAPVVVRIDVSRLDAMLLNIAANSRDAMPNGGTLRVEVRGSASGAEILMSDDGVGMDASSLAPLFEPFFTTKAPGVGTGLGLATSYTTVTQAGGTISAASELGAGTTLTISLPLANIEAVADVAKAHVEAAASTRRGSILVVEDEAEILELNADILRLAGHRVYEALDGEEALEILHGGADVDVLLTDAVMPGMSGPRLAAQVRENWPRIQVLYLSGYAAATHATDAIDPTCLLSKPISADELVRAVSAALGEID